MAELGLEFDLKARLDDFNRHIEELAAETDEARASEGLRRFLDARASFWRYSNFNQYLIALQRPDARLVASLTTPPPVVRGPGFGALDESMLDQAGRARRRRGRLACRLGPAGL